LIQKSVFDHVALMDENYFVYYDDVDFMYRALKKNEPLWYIPEAVVYHKESTSTGFMSDFSVHYLYRNLVYFALKNYSRGYAFYTIGIDYCYNLFVLIFKWPLSKWILRIRSYKEGFLVYKRLVRK
jgi:GT2 family glycosyltransferase